MTDNHHLQRIHYGITPPHECSYLPKLEAKTLVVDPAQGRDMGVYAQLIQQGFRRSGDSVYKPYCDTCQVCIATRLLVADFKPSRSQRRCLKMNQDVVVKIGPASFKQDHYDLYCRYLQSRHRHGGMDESTPESYMDFLSSKWSDTVFIEHWLDEILIAVAVVDWLDEGFSSVYTFFEPELTQRGLGNFAVLWQIAECQRRQLPYLYLGYWVEDCQKMAYKKNYQPLQLWQNDNWELMKATTNRQNQ